MYAEVQEGTPQHEELYQMDKEYNELVDRFNEYKDTTVNLDNDLGNIPDTALSERLTNQTIANLVEFNFNNKSLLTKDILDEGRRQMLNL